MTKRDREEEEEMEDFRRYRQEKKMKQLKELEEKITFSVQDLIKAFNDILKGFVSEEGVTWNGVEADLIQFVAVLNYPNDFSPLEEYPKLFKVNEGVAWITTEPVDKKKAHILIYCTSSKALKVKYVSIHNKEHSAFQAKREPKPAKNDAELVINSLYMNLALIPNTPITKERPPMEGVKIVSVTVGVEGPVKNHQLSRISSENDGKIHDIRIEPAVDLPVLMVTIDVICEL